MSILSNRLHLLEILGQHSQKSKLEKAISDYINNNASISKAANIAGLSLADFADELNKRGIIINKEFTQEYLKKTWEVMEKI